MASSTVMSMKASTSGVVRPARASAPVVSLPQKAKLFGAAAVLSAGLATAGPANADVELILPATVYETFDVNMKVTGLEVAPASLGVQEGTGHHHLVIDAPTPATGEALPFDDAHKHYGKGQTSATLTLTPGKHSITMVFANAKHEAYGGEYTKTYDVDVVAAPSAN